MCRAVKNRANRTNDELVTPMARKKATKDTGLRKPLTLAELRELGFIDDDLVIALPVKKRRKLTQAEKLVAAAAASQHP